MPLKHHNTTIWAEHSRFRGALARGHEHGQSRTGENLTTVAESANQQQHHRHHEGCDAGEHGDAEQAHACRAHGAEPGNEQREYERDDDGVEDDDDRIHGTPGDCPCRNGPNRHGRQEPLG